jgi:hypothetical protein
VSGQGRPPPLNRTTSPRERGQTGRAATVPRGLSIDVESAGRVVNQGGTVMSKSQDAKKNVKKAPTKTPKEKKEAKRLKKAGK